jgi:hypothetical protein
MMDFNTEGGDNPSYPSHFVLVLVRGYLLTPPHIGITEGISGALRQGHKVVPAKRSVQNERMNKEELAFEQRQMRERWAKRPAPLVLSYRRLSP